MTKEQSTSIRNLWMTLNKKIKKSEKSEQAMA
jgi:hypothetical protein